MTKSALFVDLPNLYTSLLGSDIAEPRELRDYFLYWFDFDRLALALTETYAPVWVFYSGKKFGPKPNRVEGSYLEEFITRINSMRGVTAYDVNIPGEQREPARFKCEQCGREGVAQWESEKGIDSSLTVHLFDTYEAWDTAFLLSGDADFVPVVRSLRRRGKIVTGASFKDASSALIRECYEYINLREFFASDVWAYRLLRKGGFTEKWLIEVHPRPDLDVDQDLKLYLAYRVEHQRSRIFLSARGNYDNSRWYNELTKIAHDTSLYRRDVGVGETTDITLELGRLEKEKIIKSFNDLTARLTGLHIFNESWSSGIEKEYEMIYQYNNAASIYVAKT